MIRKFSLLLICLFLSSCYMDAFSKQTETIFVSIDALKNTEYDLAQYSSCYIENPKNNLQFKSFEKNLKSDLEAWGINFTKNKDKANCKIEFEYGISQPQEHTVHVPIMGPTGISSFSTTSNSMQHGAGQASIYDNTVYGSYYGSETTNSFTSVNHTYGVTGHIPVNYTTYTNFLAVIAKTKDDIPLWQVLATNTSSNNDLRYIFPYLSHVSSIFSRRDTKKQEIISIEEDIFTYSYYTMNDKLYRFKERDFLYEECDIFNEWIYIQADDAEKEANEVKKKGKKVPYSYIFKKRLENEKRILEQNQF